jgi:hypothetical protein
LLTTWAPPSSRNSTVAVFADVDEFASSRYVWKKPCAPSAKYHVDAGPAGAADAVQLAVERAEVDRVDRFARLAAR